MMNRRSFIARTVGAIAAAAVYCRMTFDTATALPETIKPVEDDKEIATWSISTFDSFVERCAKTYGDGDVINMSGGLNRSIVDETLPDDPW